MSDKEKQYKKFYNWYLNNILDIERFNNASHVTRKIFYGFIEQLISERDKEIVNQAINKVLEVTKPSNDQMNIVRALRTITNTN